MEEQTCAGEESESCDSLHDVNTCGVITTGASCGIRRGQRGQEGMIGWTEEGRRWNLVFATGEGEEHHANSGLQEEQSDGGYLGDWQM